VVDPLARPDVVDPPARPDVVDPLADAVRVVEPEMA